MSSETFVWLAPTLGAMLAWGIAQGLVKKYIGEVPARAFLPRTTPSPTRP